MGLGLISLVGIAITDFSASRSYLYWVAIAPVFAGVSLYAGWARARRAGQTAGDIMLRQLLHWSALPIAVYVVYLMQMTGRLNREDAGLVALLTLALTTFLAGIHFDWRLAVLGVVLAAGALFAALVEEFFWVFLLAAIPVVAWVVWRGRRAGRSDPPGAAES